MVHEHREIIMHTIAEAEAKAATELASRWLAFAATRKTSPLVIEIACAVVHASVSEESCIVAGGTEQEADELLRTLIALARGAKQA